MSATRDPATTRTACGLCGREDLATALSLKATPLDNAFAAAAARQEPQEHFPLNLALCRGCGHVQLRDVVDRRRLLRHGPREASAARAPADGFAAFADQLVERLRLPRDSLVVGIGSGDGALLRRFKDAGLRPQGIEPAVDLAREAVADGIPTFPGFFSAAIASRIEEERGRAALVVAQDAFAQAADVGGFLEGVQLLLRRDGVFVFDVPYLLDLVEERAVDLVRHENLHYHSVGSLVRFFHSRDMELVAAERAPGRTGTLRGLVQRLGGPCRPDRSVPALAELEASRGLVDLLTYRDLGEQIEAVGCRLNAELRAIRRTGASVAGYGATAGATTLCYQLGLGPDLLDFVVDDACGVQGLYTPGQHIPVLAPEVLCERRPKAVVVLSRNQAAQIVAHHGGYRAAGGRFVIPLPEPRVL